MLMTRWKEEVSYVSQCADNAKIVKKMKADQHCKILQAFQIDDLSIDHLNTLDSGIDH